jgi:hypothetical protein
VYFVGQFFLIRWSGENILGKLLLCCRKVLAAAATRIEKNVQFLFDSHMYIFASCQLRHEVILCVSTRTCTQYIVKSRSLAKMPRGQYSRSIGTEYFVHRARFTVN